VGHTDFKSDRKRKDASGGLKRNSLILQLFGAMEALDGRKPEGVSVRAAGRESHPVWPARSAVGEPPSFNPARVTRHTLKKAAVPSDLTR
jgi:hypothetical protein